MKYFLFLIFTLSGCKFLDVPKCGKAICFPSQSAIVGQRLSSGVTAYLIEWRGEHFGVTISTSDDFRREKTEIISISIDSAAHFSFAEKEGQILAKLDGDSPKFVHFIGPCKSHMNCSVVSFAKAVTRKDLLSALTSKLAHRSN